DAGNGRLPDDRANSQEPIVPPPADRRLDGQSHEGRPRKMFGSRRFRLSGQTREHRAALIRASDVAASMNGEKMTAGDKVNSLLVDDQPAKLLSYEAILSDIGANLIKANSAKEALELLLKVEIAVILVDVCMPDLDGFELAQMIRNHPRFQKTAIIFIS